METYARMLEKKKKPTPVMIDKYLGEESAARLHQLEVQLAEHYTLVSELRFPFGNNYGWGYKFSHGRKHLCYAFFEEGAFTVTLELGDSSVARVEEVLPSLTEQARELWKNRYPCGEHGGWIHYRILKDEDLADVLALIQAKVKPPKHHKEPKAKA